MERTATKPALINTTETVKRQFDHLMDDSAWFGISDQTRAQCIDETLLTLTAMDREVKDAVGHMTWALAKREAVLRGDEYQTATL